MHPDNTWNQQKEEMFLLRDIHIITQQETWIGATAKICLTGYLKSLKKRVNWFENADPERLNMLVKWTLKNIPTVTHVGNARYTVAYPDVVPGYKNPDTTKTTFHIMYLSLIHI